MCIAIGVAAVGALLLIDGPQVKTMSLFILVGMVVAVLVLRWIFGDGGFDDDY